MRSWALRAFKHGVAAAVFEMLLEVRCSATLHRPAKSTTQVLVSEFNVTAKMSGSIPAKDSGTALPGAAGGRLVFCMPMG